MRNRILVLFLVLSLMIPFAAHADMLVQMDDNLQGFLAASGEDSLIAYRETSTGSWYLGTLKDNKYDGYGLWVFPTSDTSKGGCTFGTFSNGKFDGSCTTYYPDGSYFSGTYAAGSREGDFLYVTANGVKYCYSYSKNERVSYQEIGTAEPLFIREFSDVQKLGYVTQTADGILAAGHRISYDASNGLLYIGGIDAEGKFCGMGVYTGHSQGVIAIWEKNLVVEVETKLASTAETSDAPEALVTEPPALNFVVVTEAPTLMKERASGTYPSVVTRTPDMETPALTEKPSVTASSESATQAGIERNTMTALINDVPYTLYLAQATLDSTMEGYGISVIYAAFNPRGDLEYTIKILLDKSIAPGSFVSTDGNYECVVYLIKDMTVWEANGLGDSFYSLGYYHMEITGRSDDWMTYDGNLEAVMQVEFDYENIATLRDATFNLTIDEIYEGELFKGSGDTSDIASNANNSVSSNTLTTRSQSSDTSGDPVDTTVLLPSHGQTTCINCNGSGICPYCYGTGQMLNSYTGEYQDCICIDGKCTVCGGKGSY